MKNIQLFICSFFGVMSLFDVDGMGYSYITPSSVQRQALEKAECLNTHMKAVKINDAKIREEYAKLSTFVDANLAEILDYSDIAEYIGYVLLWFKDREEHNVEK